MAQHKEEYVGPWGLKPGLKALINSVSIPGNLKEYSILLGIFHNVFLQGLILL